jgi:hypothetical protein
VPFRDGVFVCQAAGLEDELDPLLSAAPLARPTRVENYLLSLQDDVFEVLDTDHGKIAYKPASRHVNAAHLGKLYSIDHHKLSQFFSDHPQMDKQIRRGSPAHLQGNYISFEDARILCAYFRVSPAGPVEFLIALTTAHAAGAGANDAASRGPAAGEPAKEAVYDAPTSYITEPSYANGSFLVPAAGSRREGSRLEPRNLQVGVGPTQASSTPYDVLAGVFGSDRGGHSSRPALDSA